LTQAAFRDKNHKMLIISQEARIMKKVLITLSALIASTLLLGSALANAPAQTVTAEQALQKLMDGNKRYVEHQMTGTQLCDITARKKLSAGQAPYAIILSCSDSRVPPELIFDEGLGEVFIIRVAGNVVDPIILGSIEYAAEHLGTPLVMVLGHSKCGAVKATVESNGKAEGNIGSIVKEIAPALKSVKAKKPAGDKQVSVEAVVDENVKQVKASLTKRSKPLAKLVKEGRLKLVSAKYDIEDGKVTIQEGLK
jgi:carbonic anhydrase